MCVWLCISHASLSLRLIGITRKNNMYVRNKCAAGRFLSVRFLLIAYHSWFQQHSRCCWVDVVMLLFAFVFLLLVVWSLLVWGFFFFYLFSSSHFPSPFLYSFREKVKMLAQQWNIITLARTPCWMARRMKNKKETTVNSHKVEKYERNGYGIDIHD